MDMAVGLKEEEAEEAVALGHRVKRLRTEEPMDRGGGGSGDCDGSGAVAAAGAAAAGRGGDGSGQGVVDTPEVIQLGSSSSADWASYGAIIISSDETWDGTERSADAGQDNGHMQLDRVDDGAATCEAALLAMSPFPLAKHSSVNGHAGGQHAGLQSATAAGGGLGGTARQRQQEQQQTDRPQCEARQGPMQHNPLTGGPAPQPQPEAGGGGGGEEEGCRTGDADSTAGGTGPPVTVTQSGSNPGTPSTVKFVTTWEQLVQALQTLSSQHGTSSRRAILDLGSYTLSAPPPPPPPTAAEATAGQSEPSPAPPSGGSGPSLNLSIPQLQLRNGTLLLPAGGLLRVEAPGVEMQELKIRGLGHMPDVERGETEAGLVEVRGAGSSLKMTHCKVDMGMSIQQIQNIQAESAASEAHRRAADGNRPVKRCSCVMVGKQAAAQLSNCTLLNAGRDGLLARGSGSSVTAVNCTAKDCGSSGFAAVDEGTLEVADGCIAYGCKLYGFCAEDRESVLRVRSACSAVSNGEAGFGAIHHGALVAEAKCEALSNVNHGFVALKGGQLTVGDGSVARDCEEGYGFVAEMRGSTLIVGKDCVAEAAKLSGFAARFGGKLVVGDNCVAKKNFCFGFMAEGPRSELEMGNLCSAEQNDRGGFAAVRAAKTGHSCAAIGNKLAGFLASGSHSELHVGDHFVAKDGREHTCGMVAQDGGHLVAGNDCSAIDNRDNGFLANGSESRLKVGSLCWAQGNGASGFLALKDAKMSVGFGCISSDNGDEGFCAASAVMELGKECMAFENTRDGFTVCMLEEEGAESGGRGGKGRGPAEQIGKLDMSAGGCMAYDNEGCGFCVEDSGCVLVAGPGCRADRNRGPAGFMVKEGGELQVWQGCKSKENDGAGFLAQGEGSLLRMGPEEEEEAEWEDVVVIRNNVGPGVAVKEGALLNRSLWGAGGAGEPAVAAAAAVAGR